MYDRGYVESLLGCNLSGNNRCQKCNRKVSILFAKSENLEIIYVCYECNKSNGGRDIEGTSKR